MTGVDPQAGESSTQTLARLQREQSWRWPAIDPRFGDQPSPRDRLLAFWGHSPRSASVVAGVLLAAAAVLWTWLPSATMSHWSRTALAPGTVTSVSVTDDGEQKTCLVTATFAAGSGTFHARPHGFGAPCHLAMGEPVTVQYDPDAPFDSSLLATRIPFKQLALLPFVLVPLAGLFLAYALLAYPMRWTIPRLTLVAPDAPPAMTALDEHTRSWATSGPRPPISAHAREDPLPYVPRPRPATRQVAPHGLPHQR